ncbi:uncharacterized protein LOC143543244 [Bidens hawaiensis]|uniref:uncharacterized protein LOC143543244 n=1 Tax=Bidens hawaiensis TaxID=980011 RepID=UPI00404AEB7E
MDTCNWRPAQGTSNAMEFGDCRAQLQRKRTVNKILDTLKKHLPFTEYERVQELRKTAERVEKEIYTAATSQSEYTRKICFMMLAMETRLQNPIWSNSANSSVPLENGGHWQEEVYQKIKDMKDLYLLEAGDWRAQLQANSRENIRNKIMGTLKSHLPFSGDEGLRQLRKMAVRFEEKIYTAATSQSEYTRKICFMMLTMETRLQLPIRSNSAVLYNNVNPSVSLDSTANSGGWREEVYQKIKAMKELYLLDSTAQMGNLNGEDWQEEVYQKIKAMKDLYLQDLNDMHQKILSKIHEHNSLPQQPKNGQLEKLKLFKNMLERFMQFLQIPKHGILVNCKDKLPTYERQIINVVNSNKRKPGPPQQQAMALPSPQMQSLQQSQQPLSHLILRDMQQGLATAGGFQNRSVIDMQKPLCPQKRAMPEASSNSTARTRNQNSGDWQEEVHQKIKAMKGLYLPDLNYMHQKIHSKLQQHDSLPQQPKNEQIEKMKVFKHMLERFMQFLQIPKHEILEKFKDKLGSYERQIIIVTNSNRRNPAAAQQEPRALPQGHNCCIN